MLFSKRNIEEQQQQQQQQQQQRNKKSIMPKVTDLGKKWNLNTHENSSLSFVFLKLD